MAYHREKHAKEVVPIMSRMDRRDAQRARRRRTALAVLAAALALLLLYSLYRVGTILWTYGQGASLHYPVVQGEDNEYYLNQIGRASCRERV